jgi:hypothetical protein
MQQEINRLRPAIDKLAAENNELKEKLKRATLAATRAKDAHRRSANVPTDAPYPSSLFEMDVELKMQQQVIDFAVQELYNISERTPEVQPKLNLGLTQIGIRPRNAQGKTGHTPSIATPVDSSRSGSSTHSKGSAVSFGTPSIGGDLGADAGSARSGGSKRSAGSHSSHKSGSSQGSQGSQGGTGPRPNTPRRKTTITTPRVQRP